jgi:hypothetical protein
VPAASFLAIVIMLAGPVALAAQELPPGDGRAVVSTQCAACHDLDRVVRTRLDREGWTAVVAKMVDNGAPLDERARETAIGYLVVHFGRPPAATEDPEVERIALRYINGICSSCHDTDFITDTRATPVEWREIVEDMNSKGAGLSEADVDLLAGYLARRYPAD